MFAFVVVGFFILMIFSAEFFKMWRRETEYRRARAEWDHDVDELRGREWRGKKRRREEAPEVYPAALEPATANDEGGPDDEEVRPRTAH
jgi:hypothetical protein